jgi:hypothetical protein
MKRVKIEKLILVKLLFVKRRFIYVCFAKWLSRGIANEEIYLHMRQFAKTFHRRFCKAFAIQPINLIALMFDIFRHHQHVIKRPLKWIYVDTAQEFSLLSSCGDDGENYLKDLVSSAEKHPARKVTRKPLWNMKTINTKCFTCVAKMAFPLINLLLALAL